MKIDSTKLKEAVKLVMLAVPSHTPMPVLENILFEIHKDKIYLTGMDLEKYIRVEVENSQKEEITFMAPAALLNNLLERLDGGLDLTIDKKACKLLIKTETGKYNVSITEGKDEFPAFPELKEPITKAINSVELLTALKFVRGSLSKEDMRPAFTGVYFGEQCIVATDGHKLATYEIEIGGGFILPGESIGTITNFLKEETVTIAFNKEYLKIIDGKNVIISRLIGEKFPSYESVLPKDNDKEAIVNKDEMIKSLKRIQLFAPKNSFKVRLTFSQDQVVYSAENIDIVADGRDICLAEYQGEEFSICFNGHYLRRIAENYTDEKLKLSFLSPTKPMIITGESRKYSLLMPVQDLK
jgi:DNA polymerase-3 subunit beta